MSIIGSNILAGASGNQGGYNINNSLRFRSSASAYLNRTPAIAGSLTTWTWSAWVKRGTISSSLYLELFTAGASGQPYAFIMFGLDQLQFDIVNAGPTVIGRKYTTQVFCDPSAWYHIVAVWDTTQANASNRMKLYVNGNQITTFGTSTDPALNATSQVNAATTHRIGAYTSDYFDGYMTEVNFVDGQALTPSSFGSTSTTTGSWIPKKYTGTYGTNGFYLNFSDIATTSGSNAGLGKDFSGNANYWTTNNISVTAGTTYDAMIDSPTLTSATVANYAVLNPLELGDGAPAALSNGNLTITGSASLFLRRATMNFPLTGKYYCEFTVTAVGSEVSIAYDSRGQGSATQFIQYDNSGTKNVNGTTTSYGASYTTGDVVAMAVDADGGSIAFYKNNTSQGSITFSSASMTGVNATSMVFAYTSAIVNANFGQRPFTYTPPTGFVRLNTFNLPDSTIVQGNKVMDATLWTGNNTNNRSIVNDASFKPDLVWLKPRSNPDTNQLYDSVRGAGNNSELQSNSTAAEGGNNSEVYGYMSAFNSTGFTLTAGTDPSFPYALVNMSGRTYVGWQWQAGQGSTSSNTSGTITSTVSVNATAGFSVVTYTGTGANATVGHGLGVAPSWVIVKRRDTTSDWQVRHTSIAAASSIQLNSTAAAASATTVWNSTAPSSTVFSIGTAATVNASAGTYVAYCWAEIAGFSKFGSYTGNGSTSSPPFIYTGFNPKFILIKSSTSVAGWELIDTSRGTDNALFANISDAEYGSQGNRVFSNGFSPVEINNANGSGQTYIYACFASNPFKNSNAV